MKINCVWEHNGNDTLLHAIDLPGAYTRGENLEIAMRKMRDEVFSYCRWIGARRPDAVSVKIVQDVPCSLQVRDADSDVLFAAEKEPLSMTEYMERKALTLKSAEDFWLLYQAIPDKARHNAPPRKTFYGQVPRTAEEMYQHTKNVNEYYFGEIEVSADNTGDIVACRRRGFAALEQKPDFLANPVIEGSYGEYWSLRKMLRRFLWHDRIHAKAMYRMATEIFGDANIPNPFQF